MRLLLTPRLDFVFKKLFIEDTDILTDLLNTVLELPGHRRIRSVEIRNPDILPEDIGKKFIILDIRASDDAGSRYDIEMQARKYARYPERALYYLSRMYGEQLEAGEEYGELKPVIGIHFLNYQLFPDNKDFRFRFELRDTRHPELRLTDDFSLNIFELPKLRQKDYGGPREGGLYEWLHFFNHAHEEDETMRTHYTNPMIRRAFGILERLSADEETRMRAEMRERALRDEVSMLAAAEREGIRKGAETTKNETAKNLIALGKLSADEIAQVTGISMAEIKKLAGGLEQNVRGAA